MKIFLISFLAIFSACSYKASESALKSGENIITGDMVAGNSSLFDINLRLKLPDTPLNTEESKESCDLKKGIFVSLDVVGDSNKKLCLSKDSIQSAASFVRYATDFLSIAWAGFVGESGEKKFSAIVELGSFCSDSAVGACIDVYLGEGSYDKAKMQKVLSSRPRLLEDGTIELLVRESLDNPIIEKIVKDNVNGVRLTDSFKNVIAGMAVNIISMNIPNKLILTAGDFKNIGEDIYSVKSEIILPSEWLGKSRGDFKIPFASELVSSLTKASGLAPLARKLRIMVNHDCNAMLLSELGDKNICVPVEKSSLEFVLESRAVSQIIAGEKLASSFEQTEHSYKSLKLKLGGIGIGLSKTDDASCSHRDPSNYACDMKYSLEALKYDSQKQSVIISLSNGLKTVLGNSEAGVCKSRFAVRSSFKEVIREKVAFSELYPGKDSDIWPKAVSDNLFSKITCYEEIEGSCECSLNGVPWVCRDESCK